jgi:hypothetical protein
MVDTAAADPADPTATAADPAVVAAVDPVDLMAVAMDLHLVGLLLSSLLLLPDLLSRVL